MSAVNLPANCLVVMPDAPEDTDDAQQSFTVTIAPSDVGGRLDRVLATHINAVSRSRVKALIKEGQVRQVGNSDGAAEPVCVMEPNRAVQSGDIYTISVPPAVPATPRGEDIPLDVVFEDDAVIVIDKPAGLVVHPAAGNWTGTLVNALIGHCGDTLSGIGGVRRPGIVHRLDKDTTGLMVVAKSDVAHASLAAQFAAHGRDGRMQRAYEAIVWGVPPATKGKIDAALGRATGNRTKMAVIPEWQLETRSDAKSAVTHYEILETYATEDRLRAASRVRCVLETGRTHQIRVHMAHISHPLLGDPTYGASHAASARTLGDAARKSLTGLGRQALHAVELGFEHPLTGEEMRFQSGFPDDLKALAEALAKTPDASQHLAEI